MLGNLFSIEKKQGDKKSKVTVLPVEQSEKILRQNERLKNEVNILYRALMHKEAAIIRLRKFIQHELTRSEYAESYSTLQEQLNDILGAEDAYDPRPEIEREAKEAEQSVASILKDDHDENKEAASEVLSDNKTEEEISLNTTDDSHGKLHVITNKQIIRPNQEQSNIGKEIQSPITPSKTPGSAGKKRQQTKKPAVTPLEQETITRRLFSFELEIKEYSFPVFEQVKPFVSRTNLSVDEIHDQIDKLADVACQHKYFQTVFPEDTKDMVADELENYMFEILYPKLFIVDEDAKGFNQQFKDRLNVLKSLVTYSLLEIPEGLRKDSLYTAAIRELEKMNQFKAPMWKLKAFQNSVNYIVLAYHQVFQREPNSDELFPLLIYIVLQANIELFKFNVDYIYNHLRKPHLLGQFGFLIINLKAIIQFLSDINGNALCEGKLEMRRM